MFFTKQLLLGWKIMCPYLTYVEKYIFGREWKRFILIIDIFMFLPRALKHDMRLMNKKLKIDVMYECLIEQMSGPLVRQNFRFHN